MLKAVRGKAGESELAHEFERLTRLEHPSLPRVRDLGVLAADLGPMPAGTLYFTCDEIEGAPLDAAVAAAPAGERPAILWAAAIDAASALAHIHAAGLCHCDVTPRNLLVTGRGDEVRAVLIDLGLSAMRGVAGEARGTLAYMAPEALAGAVDPRADLWGLGASLHHAASGAPPFGDDGAATIRAILTRPPPRIDRARAPGLADVIARLLARDPAARPASALALFDELVDAAAALPRAPRARPRPTVRPPLVAPTTIGAADALAAIDAALATCHAGEVVTALAVCGPIGAGAAEVVAHAIRRHQLDAASRGKVPLTIIRGALDAVAAALAGDGAGEHGRAPDANSRSDGGRATNAAEVIERATARGDTATIIDATGDERAGVLLAAISRASGPGLVIVVAEGVELPAGAAGVALGAVGVAELRALAAEMLGRPPPEPWVEQLARASRGLPALAAAIVTALAAADDPFSLDPERDAAGASLDELRVGHIRTRGRGAVAAAEALAAWDGDASYDVLAATVRRADASELPSAVRAIGELCEVGAARRDRGRVLMARGLVEAVRRATEPARLEAWHRAAVAVARERGLPAGGWTFHLAALPADPGSIEPLCEAARDLLARGRPARALELARAAARTPGEAGARAALLAARAAMTAGAYPDAVALAQRAVDELDGAEARLVLARAHQRAGDGAAAETILAALAAEQPGDADVAGAYARLLVARGRYDDALAAVAAVGALPRSSGGALCAEAAGSALLYRGDAAAADARFVEAEAIAVALGDRALMGRARSLRGMAAQHRGDLAAASAWYRDAAVDSRAGGDLHAAAIAELNHGTTLAERGRHGEALPVLAAATAALAALGHVVERAAAEIDRGLSLLAVGQVDAADAAARAAAAAADVDRAPHLAVFARLLAGDVARRRGDVERAAAAYEDARALAARHQLADERHAWRAIAVLDATRDPANAAALLAALDAADATADDRDRTLLARGRIALAQAQARLHGGAHALAQPHAPPNAHAEPHSQRKPQARAQVHREPGFSSNQGALATSVAVRPNSSTIQIPWDPGACPLWEVAQRAQREDRRDRAWRAAWLSAALAEVHGARDVVAQRVRVAEQAWRALEGETPAVFRAGLASDPDAVALARLAAEVAPPVVRAERVGGEIETVRLRRLLALSRRLHAETSLERLLDEVIDTAIELTRAERGFLLLERGRGLEVVVARGFAAGALADPSAVSRSIAQRAVDGGEPVVTVDAGVDERFGGAASVAAHRLRSVVAVPLHQRGQVGGCLYVDHRLRSSAFDEEATGLVVELADIAALAIDNARHAEELRRQKAELDVLAQRLGAEVAEREAELAAVRSRLPVTRDRLGPGLDAIVGTSPAVLAMLDVVQRAARVTSPVVIVGESGTGKELVARALHDAGPRRDRPFVAVNCGAMPEHLLESELFGHVRGAFTGAERDRRGLFEVADGGTLFLDEIADTGPAMQAKLLRVLQDGVLRRVGDDRTRQVDVRIVAATQRPLAELAAAGEFRDDLRFRLEVITVRVPPLRERAADLPQLVEHLLARLAPGKAPPLTRAAWRALAAHAWPGNVRELENALARAVALGGEVIDEHDLPEAIAARVSAPAVAGAPVPPTDDLRLRPAIDAIERAYLAAALERARGNQTVAARLLGLSRFGLQKKLRRVNGEDGEVE